MHFQFQESQNFVTALPNSFSNPKCWGCKGNGTKLPWWLELVSKLRGGVLEVEVCEVVVV